MLIKDQDQVREAPLARPQSGEKVWIDVVPGDKDSIHETIQVLQWDSNLQSILGAVHERAQLQYVGAVLVLTVLVPGDDREMSVVDILLGPDVLVTIHRSPVPLLTLLAQELQDKPHLLDSAHYLLYEILERISDSFLEMMDHYEEEFDELEDSVLNGHDRAHDVFGLRHQLHRIRSVLADMRRIAARLSRRQFTTSDGEVGANIFVDVYDGFYHVMDNIDSLRDNLTGLVDLQLNQRGTRLNEIMKFLTIFSTIFLPLSFITGFFGMNLKSMPELAIPYGQEFTLLLMISVVVSMLWVFKRRHWL